MANKSFQGKKRKYKITFILSPARDKWHVGHVNCLARLHRYDLCRKNEHPQGSTSCCHLHGRATSTESVLRPAHVPIPNGYVVVSLLYGPFQLRTFSPWNRPLSWCRFAVHTCRIWVVITIWLTKFLVHR